MTDTERDVSSREKTPLRSATLVIYVTTAILLLAFPVSLANWMEDKDFGTTSLAQWVATPVVDRLAVLAPAGWSTAARDRAKRLSKRSD